MKLYLDNSKMLEYLCDTTEKVVYAKFGDSAVVDDDEVEDGTKYTEEAQDFFNEQYDEIETILHTVLGVHSEDDAPNEKPDCNTVGGIIQQLMEVEDKTTALRVWQDGGDRHPIVMVDESSQGVVDLNI